jgi:prophage regulatory protein
LTQHTDAPGREAVASAAVNLVGITEICDLLFRACRDRVLELTFRSDFPEPAAELAEGDVWIREDVDAFLAGYGEVLADLFKATY